MSWASSNFQNSIDKKMSYGSLPTPQEKLPEQPPQESLISILSRLYGKPLDKTATDFINRMKK